MKLALPFLLLACAVSARAADSVKLSGKNAEDVLRKFVTADPRLKAKLGDASKREEAFLAESRDSDLRDAVSDANGPDALKRELEKAAGEKRIDVLNRLPGVKPPVASSCVNLADCGHPDLAVDVADAEQLPDAIRGLVRPWLLLQSARGSALTLTPVSGDAGDAVLTATLKGVKAEPLTLNVTPHLLGGFRVWFDRPLELAALYGRERDAALGARR